MPHNLNDLGVEDCLGVIPTALFKKLTSQLVNEFKPGKSVSPDCRDSLDTMPGNDNLAEGRGGGCGNSAEVDLARYQQGKSTNQYVRIQMDQPG